MDHVTLHNEIGSPTVYHLKDKFRNTADNLNICGCRAGSPQDITSFVIMLIVTGLGHCLQVSLQ